MSVCFCSCIIISVVFTALGYAEILRSFWNQRSNGRPVNRSRHDATSLRSYYSSAKSSLCQIRWVEAFRLDQCGQHQYTRSPCQTLCESQVEYSQSPWSQQFWNFFKCFIGHFSSTTVLQDVAAYLKLLPPPDNSDKDEKDKQFLMELLVTI